MELLGVDIDFRLSIDSHIQNICIKKLVSSSIF